MIASSGVSYTGNKLRSITPTLLQVAAAVVRIHISEETKERQHEGRGGERHRCTGALRDTLHYYIPLATIMHVGHFRNRLENQSPEGLLPPAGCSAPVRAPSETH